MREYSTKIIKQTLLNCWEYYHQVWTKNTQISTLAVIDFQEDKYHTT